MSILNRLEKSIENSTLKYAKKLDFIVLKLNNPASKGWPDRLFIDDEAVHFYIEFKRKGSKARKLQEYRIETLAAKGCIVYEIDNIKEGLNVIRYHKNKRNMDTPPISRRFSGDYGFTISSGIIIRSRSGEN